MKKRVLIFHPALAPYRVDQFNYLNEIFDLHIIFIFNNVWNHKFDQDRLKEQSNFKSSYLLIGPNYKGRVFRFGILLSILKFKPDLVIAYEFSFTTLYLTFLKQIGLVRCKIGTTIDDSLDICENIQSKPRELARKYVVNNIDFLVVLSKEVKTYYLNHFNLISQQIITAPILQNPDRLRKHSSKLIDIAKTYIERYDLDKFKVLLFVGRFIPEKGLVNFINIISPFLKNDSSIRLVLVGDGSEKESIIKNIKYNNVEKSIVLAGRYEGDELLAWYVASSGFVLPSIFEPFGAVVNEAIVFGLPVLCSKYVGSKYLLSNVLDCIYDPDELEESAVKIRSFLSSLASVNIRTLSIKPSRMSLEEFSEHNNWNELVI